MRHSRLVTTNSDRQDFTRSLFALLMLLALACVIPRISFANTVSVRIEPELSRAQIDDLVSVDIIGRYEQPASLIGGSLSLVFDPAIVQLLDVTIDPLLADLSQTVGTIDNTAGTVDIIGFASQSGSALPEFEIATLTFQALAAGRSLIELSDPQDIIFVWVDADQVLLSPNFQAGEILVEEETIPSTTTTALFGLSLCLMAIARRWRTR